MHDLGLLVAATLTFGLGAAHSWLGERELIGPLLAPQTRAGLLADSGFARRVLRFAWHLTTVAWWGIAAALAMLALMPIDPQGRVALIAIAATFLATGFLILVTSRGRHLAWPVCFAIAGLALAPAM